MPAVQAPTAERGVTQPGASEASSRQPRPRTARSEALRARRRGTTPEQATITSKREKRRQDHQRKLQDPTYLELHRSVAKARERLRAERNVALRFVSGIIEPIAYRKSVERMYKVFQANPSLVGSEKLLDVGFVREVSRTALGKLLIGKDRFQGGFQEGKAKQQGIGRTLEQLRNVASGGQELITKIIDNSPQVKSFSHDIAAQVLLKELKPDPNEKSTEEEKLDKYTKAVRQSGEENGHAITDQDARILAEGMVLIAGELKHMVSGREIKSPEMARAFDAFLQKDLDPHQKEMLQKLVTISKRRAFVFDLTQGKSAFLIGAGLLHAPPLAAGGMLLAGVAGTAISTYYRLRFGEMMHKIDTARGVIDEGNKGLLTKIFDVEWDKVNDKNRALQYTKAIAANSALSVIFFGAGRFLQNPSDAIHGFEEFFGGRGGGVSHENLVMLAQHGSATGNTPLDAQSIGHQVGQAAQVHAIGRPVVEPTLPVATGTNPPNYDGFPGHVSPATMLQHDAAANFAPSAPHVTADTFNQDFAKFQADLQAHASGATLNTDYMKVHADVIGLHNQALTKDFDTYMTHLHYGEPTQGDMSTLLSDAEAIKVSPSLNAINQDITNVQNAMHFGHGQAPDYAAMHKALAQLQKDYNAMPDSPQKEAMLSHVNQLLKDGNVPTAQHLAALRMDILADQGRLNGDVYSQMQADYYGDRFWSDWNSGNALGVINDFSSQIGNKLGDAAAHAGQGLDSLGIHLSGGGGGGQAAETLNFSSHMHTIPLGGHQVQVPDNVTLSHGNLIYTDLQGHSTILADHVGFSNGQVTGNFHDGFAINTHLVPGQGPVSLSEFLHQHGTYISPDHHTIFADGRQYEAYVQAYKDGSTTITLPPGDNAIGIPDGHGGITMLHFSPSDVRVVNGVTMVHLSPSDPLYHVLVNSGAAHQLYIDEPNGGTMLDGVHNGTTTTFVTGHYSGGIFEQHSTVNGSAALPSTLQGQGQQVQLIITQTGNQGGPGGLFGGLSGEGGKIVEFLNGHFPGGAAGAAAAGAVAWGGLSAFGGFRTVRAVQNGQGVGGRVVTPVVIGGTGLAATLALGAITASGAIPGAGLVGFGAGALAALITNRNGGAGGAPGAAGTGRGPGGGPRGGGPGGGRGAGRGARPGGGPGGGPGATPPSPPQFARPLANPNLMQQARGGMNGRQRNNVAQQLNIPAEQVNAAQQIVQREAMRAPGNIASVADVFHDIEALPDGQRIDLTNQANAEVVAAMLRFSDGAIPTVAQQLQRMAYVQKVVTDNPHLPSDDLLEAVMKELAAKEKDITNSNNDPKTTPILALREVIAINSVGIPGITANDINTAFETAGYADAARAVVAAELYEPTVGVLAGDAYQRVQAGYDEVGLVVAGKPLNHNKIAEVARAMQEAFNDYDVVEAERLGEPADRRVNIANAVDDLLITAASGNHLTELPLRARIRGEVMVGASARERMDTAYRYFSDPRVAAHITAQDRLDLVGEFKAMGIGQAAIDRWVRANGITPTDVQRALDAANAEQGNNKTKIEAGLRALTINATHVNDAAEAILQLRDTLQNVQDAEVQEAVNDLALPPGVKATLARAVLNNAIARLGTTPTRAQIDTAARFAIAASGIPDQQGQTLTTTNLDAQAIALLATNMLIYNGGVPSIAGYTPPAHALVPDVPRLIIDSLHLDAPQIAVLAKSLIRTGQPREVVLDELLNTVVDNTLPVEDLARIFHDVAPSLPTAGGAAGDLDSVLTRMGIQPTDFDKRSIIYSIFMEHPGATASQATVDALLVSGGTASTSTADIVSVVRGLHLTEQPNLDVLTAIRTRYPATRFVMSGSGVGLIREAVRQGQSARERADIAVLTVAPDTTNYNEIFSMFRVLGTQGISEADRHAAMRLLDINETQRNTIVNTYLSSIAASIPAYRATGKNQNRDDVEKVLRERIATALALSGTPDLGNPFPGQGSLLPAIKAALPGVDATIIDDAWLKVAATQTP